MTRIQRRLALGAGALLGVLLIAMVLLRVIIPGLIQDRIRAEATRALERVGLVPDIGAVDITFRGDLALRDLCLRSLAEPSVELACIDRIEVLLDGLPLRASDVEVRRVAVSGGWVHAQEVDGTLAGWLGVVERVSERPDRERDRDDESDREREARALPELVVERLTFRTDQLDGVSRAIGLVRATLSGSLDAGEQWQGEVLLEPPGGELTLARGGMLLSLPAQVQLHARGSEREPLGLELSIPGDALLQVGLPVDGGTVQLEIGGLSLSDPADLVVDSPRVLFRGLGDTMMQIAAAERLEVDLRERPSALSDVYVSRLQLVSPALHLSTDLPFLAGLLPAFVEETDDEAGEDEDVAEEDVEEADTVDDSIAAAGDEPGAGERPGIRGAIAGRQWYEVWPQFVEVDGGTVVLEDARDPEAVVTLVVEDLSLRYALRVFRMQIDVEVSARVQDGEGRVLGQFGAEAVWGYSSQVLNLDLELEEMDLGAFGSLVRWPAGVEPTGGRMNARVRYRDAERRQPMSAGVELEVRDFSTRLPRLEEPVAFERLRWALEAEEEVEEREGERPLRHLRVREGDGELDGARFALRPSVLGWRLSRAPHLLGLEIAWSVPDQGAQDLFDAVPRALRADLGNVRLGGRFGQDLVFRVDLDPVEGGGRPRMRIHAPSVDDFRDNVTLEGMPDRVDPRRLAHGFEFVFRGPDDRIQRRISVPPFHSALDPAEVVIDEVTGWPRRASNRSRTEEEGWAPLDEISYYLVAMQLHREDGRFFENSGVNWYQVRRVVEEAWHREEGFRRGASTITMQLVKNVLLSHDRTVDRKVQELFLTYWLTRHVPKERILEIYLNVIEWGPGVNGIVEAAEHYFGKTPAELTLAEATWLSAITPAPMRRSVQRDRGEVPDWFWRQCQQLMRGLERRRMITSRELEEGLASRPRFVTAPPRPEPMGEPEGLDEGEGEGDGEAGEEPLVLDVAALEPGMRPAGPQARFLTLSGEARVRDMISRARPLGEATGRRR